VESAPLNIIAQQEIKEISVWTVENVGIKEFSI
jgi:hypothetical protein